MLTTQRDPAVHVLSEVPVIFDLRRESGFGDELIVYRHDLTGKWVLALLSDNRRYMYELGYVDGKTGDTFHPTRKEFKRLVERLRRAWKTPAEVIHEFKMEQCVSAESHVNQMAEEDEYHRSFYRYLRKTHGSTKADAWADGIGLENVAIHG